MHMKSVPFENHPDSLMNDWIISLEIAIKQLVCAKKVYISKRIFTKLVQLFDIYEKD